MIKNRKLMLIGIASMFCLGGCNSSQQELTEKEIMEVETVDSVVQGLDNESEGQTLKSESESEIENIQSEDVSELYNYEIQNGEVLFRKCMTEAEEVEIPEEIEGYPVTELRMSAFKDNLDIKKVIIPDTVRIIGDRCFRGCDKLEQIVIGENVESIGEDAFILCTSLKTLNIPASVKSIGPGAIIGCYSLEEIHIKGKDVEIAESNFEENAENCIVYAPAGSTTEAYIKEIGGNFQAE